MSALMSSITPSIENSQDYYLAVDTASTASLSTIGASGTLTSNSAIGITSYPYYTNIGTINTGSNLYYDSSKWTSYINPLQNLKYNLDFNLNDTNKKKLLEDNIKGIKKNKFLFNCKYDGNRIQPYEIIMKLIEDKEKISVKVKVSDILTISYTGFQFIKIENNLDFNSDCDFSVLKVKFKYENVLYENHKLSEKELRTDKLNKIMKTENNN